ncbi:MAG: GNAT family N-acetyltransferase [Phycisphaerae bacterium]|jgi:ribosomal protein S18 acetylase RimI-like enzyme
MSPPVTVSPVPAAAQRQALEFLLGGARRDVLIAARAEALGEHLRSQGRRGDLWWACVGRRCVAAAMVVHNPGRTGLLLYSPAEAAGVDRQALAAASRAAAQEGLSQGAALVQVMVEDGNDADLAMVQAAGFSPLARLAHMRLALAWAAGGESPGPSSGPRGRAGEISWRSAEQFSMEELASVITATYEDSLDCPPLHGRRSIDDVITCHRASGVFRPRSWWIVDVGGAAAGCVLMNDSTAGYSAEIVYLGVAPRFRGQGLGRCMLRHAAADAKARGLERIELAVDDKNSYAKRLYESEGYRVMRRQWAYVLFPNASARSESGVL